MAKELLKRSEVKEEYTWNLKDMYASDEDWKKDLDEIDKILDEIGKMEGKVAAFFHPASIVALVLFFLPLSLITSDSPLSFIFDSFTYDVDKRNGNFYNIPIKTAG